LAYVICYNVAQGNTKILIASVYVNEFKHTSPIELCDSTRRTNVARQSKHMTQIMRFNIKQYKTKHIQQRFK